MDMMNDMNSMQDLAWDEEGEVAGIRILAYFFDPAEVNARSDAAARMLPIFRVAKPKHLIAEEDRSNFVAGDLIGQPDGVFELGSGMLSLEYKSNSRPHDRSRWASQMRMTSVLQAIGGAMVVSCVYQKPTAALLRVENALYLLDPRQEVIDWIGSHTTAAKEYWDEDKRVNITQLAEFCEPRIRSMFRKTNVERAAEGERRHAEMLRRNGGSTT